MQSGHESSYISRYIALYCILVYWGRVSLGHSAQTCPFLTRPLNTRPLTKLDLLDMQERVGFDDYPGVEGALDRFYRLAVLVKEARGDLGIDVQFDLFLLRLLEIFFDFP